MGNAEKIDIEVFKSVTRAIAESDVLLAEASQAVIIGFHVTTNPQAKEIAQKEGLDLTSAIEILGYKTVWHGINAEKAVIVKPKNKKP